MFSRNTIVSNVKLIDAVRLGFLLPTFLVLLFSASSTVFGADNLLVNPSFEQVTAGIPDSWTPKHSTTFFEATTSKVKDGNYATVLSKVPGKKGWTLASQEIDVTAGETYELSGWAIWNDDSISNVKLRVDWRDSDGSRVELDDTALDEKSSEFQFLSLSAVAPEGAIMARVEIFTNLSAADPSSPPIFDHLVFSLVEPEVITFTHPSEVFAEQGFDVTVVLTGGAVSTPYYLKVLLGSEETTLQSGRTLSASGSNWLAWNAGWDNFPIITTDSDGNGEQTVQAKVSGSDVVAGSYYIKARAREVGSEDNVDSNVSQLAVSWETTPIFVVREMEEGRVTTAMGCVTAPVGLLGDNVLYLQDDSGGLRIKYTGELPPNYRKNVLQVWGEVKESWGETYLKADRVSLTATDCPKVHSTHIDTRDVGEKYEGLLVNLEGEVVETSGDTFYINDGTDDAKIYIREETNIEKPYTRTGYSAKIKGVISQWGQTDEGKDNYRVMPYEQNQVDIAPPEEEVLGATTQDGDILPTAATTNIYAEEILGAHAQLPITGLNPSWMLGVAGLCLGVAGRLVCRTKKEILSFLVGAGGTAPTFALRSR